MIKVVKFGGSSLADAVQIKKAGKIVLSEESRRYVVPSAPGKRFSDDTKVTFRRDIRKSLKGMGSLFLLTKNLPPSVIILQKRSEEIMLLPVENI